MLTNILFNCFVLLLGSIKLLKKFNYDNAMDDAEKYIKNAPIQAPFNIKKKYPLLLMLQ